MGGIAETCLIVEPLIRAMVDEPERVEVVALPGQEIDLIQIRVSRKDLGKIIGRQGRIALSLRTIVKAIAKTQRTAYKLDLVAHPIADGESDALG